MLGLMFVTLYSCADLVAERGVVSDEFFASRYAFHGKSIQEGFYQKVIQSGYESFLYVVTEDELELLWKQKGKQEEKQEGKQEPQSIDPQSVGLPSRFVHARRLYISPLLAELPVLKEINLLREENALLPAEVIAYKMSAMLSDEGDTSSKFMDVMKALFTVVEKTNTVESILIVYETSEKITAQRIVRGVYAYFTEHRPVIELVDTLDTDESAIIDAVSETHIQFILSTNLITRVIETRDTLRDREGYIVLVSEYPFPEFEIEGALLVIAPGFSELDDKKFYRNF